MYESLVVSITNLRSVPILIEISIPELRDYSEKSRDCPPLLVVLMIHHRVGNA